MSARPSWDPTGCARTCGATGSSRSSPRPAPRRSARGGRRRTPLALPPLPLHPPATPSTGANDDLPNVGDELHHFGWNRCSSACHGPDRSHLIVPGFRSSRVHCMPGGLVVLSMLGDADGAGGFAVIDADDFSVLGRWENGGEHPPLNYDFWYQPRKNVLISSDHKSC